MCDKMKEKTRTVVHIEKVDGQFQVQYAGVAAQVSPDTHT